MEKIYNKTQWENTPSTNTPINETNLNNIENGVDALDDRVVELSNTKSNVDWVQLQKSGDKIAEITIDGVKRTVYAKSGSGGGGGGTTDYEDLDNKPKINNVELNGNKTLSDLGINAESVGALPNTTIIPTTLAELAEDTTHRTVTDAEKTKWNEGGGGGSTVSWNQIVTSGTKIAEVSVDGNKTDVYAPNGGSGGGGTASDITYDNSTSGMTATNVQDAIDEQKQDLNQKGIVFGTPTSPINFGEQYWETGANVVLYTATKKCLVALSPTLVNTTFGTFYVNGYPMSKFYTTVTLRYPTVIPMNEGDVLRMEVMNGRVQEMELVIR